MLKKFNEIMESLNLNYEFDKMTQSPPVYPYWVGEYSDTEEMNEDGQRQGTIILNGFSRNDKLTLERDKDKIRRFFQKDPYCHIDSGGILFGYGGAFDIREENDELSRTQITIPYKKWRNE